MLLCVLVSVSVCATRQEDIASEVLYKQNITYEKGLILEKIKLPKFLVQVVTKLSYSPLLRAT